MNTKALTAGTADTPSHARWALLALAIGAFGIGTTEFSPMGLLPVIADGVGVSIPTAGLLVSAYAIGVMVGAPIMTLAFSRFGKRTALMLLMAIFTIGNLLSALSPATRHCCWRASSPASTTAPFSASAPSSPPASCRATSRRARSRPCSWA